jgi:response regulator RpfG family c-di-GMP phosphodiesterase/DNA-binding CsgD family transcriptional regulator
MDKPALEETQVSVLCVTKALAFIGDLSMGQPTDHSPRTAWLATRLAEAAGAGAPERDLVQHVALLRWSGCTANAHGFAELFGDDVAERAAMLARRPDTALSRAVARGDYGGVLELARIHCEVSGDIARMLGLDAATQAALRHIFESYDATGVPNRVAGADVPGAVFVVALAGDLEILSRTYGVDAALALLAQDGGKRYPAELVATLLRHGQHWHDTLAHESARSDASGEAAPDFYAFLRADPTTPPTSLELIADVIDLKLPWMTQYSQRVANACRAACAALGSSGASQGLAYRAALMHGMGRAAIPNALWNTAGRLPAAAWEQVRLAPYWTLRAGQHIGALQAEAQVASHAYERLDGSGYFRAASAAAIGFEARVLGAACAWIALLSPRPWRAAFGVDEAAAMLLAQAQAGRFDLAIVRALVNTHGGAVHAAPPLRSGTCRMKPAQLSERETQILRHISQGMTNKEAARCLEISTSTVRTHVESVFRKLECSSRAAATLKAAAMGLL